VGWGNQAIFELNASSLENDSSQLQLMTNRKLHYELSTDTEIDDLG